MVERRGQEFSFFFHNSLKGKRSINVYDDVSWNYLRFLFCKMGFGVRWIKWMKACVFNSSMSMLVNGSVTEDFKVGKGLQQGDSLSSFLFGMVMEGLTSLMYSAVELGEYNCFKINKDASIDILQFSDDTTIIGDGSSDNLWSIKVIIRGFEMISGLCVKFCKSNIYGSNISN